MAGPHALRLVALALLLLLASCQTENQARLSAAASARNATTELAQSLPQKLPETCTAEMGEALARADEPIVVTIDRWRVLRANRNDQAAACGHWWDDYRRRLTAR